MNELNEPSTLLIPAKYPIAVFPDPVVLSDKASVPMPTFSPPLLVNSSELYPTPTLLLSIVCASEYPPMAILFLPEAFCVKVENPIPVFPAD